MTHSNDEARTVVRNVYACFFLSGALGLIYQILWLRKLLLVFGSTVHAVSTVLTVFFGGLALGSWWLGRAIDRHEGRGLRWYAMLETGIGFYALLTPMLFSGIQHIYIPVYRASGFSPTVLVLASFLCAAAILLLPTMLMGGTFPVLSRFLIRTSEERGVKIAGIYGINTAGAMTGTLLVYFVGLPILGFTRTLVCAAVLNVGIGLLCLVFDRHLESLGFHLSASTPAPAQPLAREATDGDPRWLFLAFGLSGFSAMVYEVAWTRALSLVLGSSIYAFCMMLTAFLGGMALGSGFARRNLRRQPASVSQFIVIEFFLGAYGLVSIPLFSQLPDWFIGLWPLLGGSFSGLTLLQLTLSFFSMIIPTFLMGVLFPIVSDLVTGRFAQLGRTLGSAYAINTLGGIAGSFLSGFVLIPQFGLPWGIAAAAIVNLAAGCLLMVRYGRLPSLARVGLAAVALAVAAVLSQQVIVPTWQRQAFAAGVYLNPESYRNMTVQQGIAGTKLLYYRDSLNATVSVHQQGETIYLKVGGKTDASNGMDMGTQVLSAHIPLLLHGHPERVLVIGLGSGVTLGHAARYPLATLHCAELDPAVIEGARLFKAYNYDVHHDPRTTIFAVDGRNFLMASPLQYDVIISEPSNPWMTGIAYLFTREFYQLAKHRLAPGGLMCQWLQLYRINPTDVKLVLKTFHAEFPYVSVWSSIPGDLLLVGSMEPRQLDYARLAAQMASPKISESLRTIKIEGPETLLRLYWFGSREIEALTSDITWLHEDDQPSLEFSAPKALYAGPTFLTNYGGLERFKGQPQAIARGYDPAREDAAFYRGLGALWSYRAQNDKAKEALERAVALDPSSGDGWERLGELYLQTRELLKAQEALTKATQLAPRRAAPYRVLARMYWQQKKLEDAQRFYEQAARLEPPDGLIAEEIGRCFKESRQFPWAAEYFRSAVSQDGGSRSDLVLAYAEVLTELKSRAAAEQVLRFGMASFPANGSFALRLGEALMEQGRQPEAETCFRQALAVAPRSVEAYYGLGRIALGRGEVTQAVRYLRYGLRFNPYHREALELLEKLQHQET